MKDRIIVLLAICVMVITSNAQDSSIRENLKKQAINPFGKKVSFGISWNQYWGTITGKNLPEEYFSKPCIGYNLMVQYYPVSFAGIGIGAGFQQRGAGIISPDNSGGSFTHPWEDPVGDPDSTYRRRLRYNALELPITILLRTPGDVIRGVRPSAAFGFTFIKPRSVHDFFFSVEDGFHTDEIVTDQYASRDLATQFSIGADIDAGGGSVLQAHLVLTKGTRNVFAGSQGDGRMETIGFRLAFLY